ncbi:hypothetical protein HDV06_005820 [Boothiomyces sp. JEL0866]|nr:hypothetical protein HDV06_005820 [Boothiomyces sp. JEL0866]
MYKVLLLAAACFSLVFELDTVGIDFDDLQTLISAKSNPPPSILGNLDILVNFESIPFQEPKSNKIVIINGATDKIDYKVNRESFLENKNSLAANNQVIYMGDDDDAQYWIGQDADLIYIPKDLMKRQASSIICPQTAQACQTQFSNCSAHGLCTKQAHPLKVNTFCYFCSCTVNYLTDQKGNRVKNYDGPVKWSGNSCEYQDISISFHILLWLTVALVVITIFCVSLLYSVGDSFGYDQNTPPRAKTD